MICRPNRCLIIITQGNMLNPLQQRALVVQWYIQNIDHGHPPHFSYRYEELTVNKSIYNNTIVRVMITFFLFKALKFFFLSMISYVLLGVEEPDLT